MIIRIKGVSRMENFDKTMKFDYEEIPKEDVKAVLKMYTVHWKKEDIMRKSNSRLFAFW